MVTLNSVQSPDPVMGNILWAETKASAVPAGRTVASARMTMETPWPAKSKSLGPERLSAERLMDRSPEWAAAV